MKYFKISKVPKGAGFTFPPVPPQLGLCQLEERLVALRIPFMQLRELPRGGQLSVRGNVVNVPSDVNTTVNMLPRTFEESQTIPVQLKRKLSYKHAYEVQAIRPQSVRPTLGLL